MSDLPGRMRAALRTVAVSRPARRATLRRVVALAVALALALWAHGQLAAATDLRRGWAESYPVVVARHRIEPGEELSAGDLETQRRPASLVPEGALRSLPDAHRRAVAMIAPGEVVVGSRLGRGGALAWRVPPGRAAVTVEVQGGAPPVEAGDEVDVLATDGGSEAVTVARAAVVLQPGGGQDSGPLGSDGDARTLTLAVAAEDLSATGAAVLAGPVAVALRSAGG